MGPEEDDRYYALEKLTPYLWRRRLKPPKQGALYLHWCQGCGHAHSYPVEGARPNVNWTFNNKPESPSFTPSMLIFIPQRTRENGEVVPQKTTCHYYVTDGQIQYQGDCPHQYSGQTLPLQPIPDDYGF